MVVVRKNLSVEKGEQVLFDDIRYFFYLTNDTSLSAAEVVFFANERCDQENVIEQLKNGVNALRMPSDDLVSNWAYMVIAALAWNLKSWYGLMAPDKSVGHAIGRMEFKRFLHSFILIPCQIVKTGRRLVFRSSDLHPTLGSPSSKRWMCSSACALAEAAGRSGDWGHPHPPLKTQAPGERR